MFTAAAQVAAVERRVTAYSEAGQGTDTVERVGRFCRYDVEVCRAWLAARPTRVRRGRRLNGGTLNVPISAGVELHMRDQLRDVAQRLDVSVSTLLREGARRVLMALGEPVDPPERLPHLRDDHPFRRLQR